MPRNLRSRETPIVADALRSVTALLPNSWRLRSGECSPTTDEPPEAVVSLIPLAGEGATFLVTTGRSGTFSRSDTADLQRRAQAAGLPPLFLSDYIGPSLRGALAEAGVSYADATGWVRITADSPLVLLTGRGADKSPQAGRPTAVTRLNGLAAGRIVRTLCEHDPPFGVRDLASRADVSPGSVSKLLPTLATEGIIDRTARGGVARVRRRALISRWALDYSFTGTNDSAGYFLAPRGLDRTLARIHDAGARVTLTGSAAARRLLPEGATSVLPLRLLSFYADVPGTAAETLGLIPADLATANTVIAAPQDPQVLNNETAPVAVVLADLLTLPGRGDAEAEQLMGALSRIDTSWET